MNVRVFPLAVAGLALAAVAPPVGAQPRLPFPSPAASVSQEIGTSRVTIEYHRPAVRGRAIWGALVPYGETWRLGANEATTLTLTHAAKVAGKDVPAGTYALFAVPGKERWTLVLNRKAKQWGAYFTDPKEDLLRFEVSPVAAPHAEWMTFALEAVEPAAVRVSWAWERLAFSFPVEFDVPGVVWADVDAALKAKPDDHDTLLQSARWALRRGERLAEGRAWLDRSIAVRESFWNRELLASYLREEGKTAEAIAALRRAVELSKGKAPDGYWKALEETIAKWEAEKGR
jgi:hypothetical protein